MIQKQSIYITLVGFCTGLATLAIAQSSIAVAQEDAISREPAAAKSCKSIQLERPANYESRLIRKLALPGEVVHPYRQVYVKLAKKNLNPKSYCVRVDGSPVRSGTYFGANNVVTFIPPANPESVVKISYCLNETRCENPCNPGQDVFFAALGAKLKSEGGSSRKVNQSATDSTFADPEVVPLVGQGLAKEIYSWEEWNLGKEQSGC